jgi:hypothetical protein
MVEKFLKLVELDGLTALLLLGACVVIVLLTAAIARYVKTQPPKQWFKPLPPVEIARISEHVEFSGGGVFAVLMLILSNIFAIIILTFTTNILQQNVAMLGWIGWNILWGIGAIIGRRRRYIVHRADPPQP